MINQIGIIGLGLIGGSLAKSFKKHQVCQSIVAYDTNIDSLYSAKYDSVIDKVATNIDSRFSKCDIIFICCPVNISIDIIRKLIPIINKSCILTDVSSTKDVINQYVNQLDEAINFIGGHPMTGSEKSGYDSASTMLFENTYYILSKTTKTKANDLNQLKDIISQINAIPVILEGEEHDYATAMISHVPHIIASALVNQVKAHDSNEKIMHTLAAGGFKDITRIASANPKMWEQVCLSNTNNIIRIIEDFKDALSIIQSDLANYNASGIYQFFETSKEYRNSFESKTHSDIVKTYSITIDVEDKPGIIGEVATLLSQHKINIKNIGIINNREHVNGVLEVIFYDKNHREESYDLLLHYGYTVYKL